MSWILRLIFTNNNNNNNRLYKIYIYFILNCCFDFWSITLFAIQDQNIKYNYVHKWNDIEEEEEEERKRRKYKIGE